MRRTRQSCLADALIETERLVLRDWRDEDRAPFAAMSADGEVMRHLNGPTGRAASDALIDRLRGEAQTGFTFWAIERRADGALLGFCGLRRGGHAGTPVVDVLEIGWRLRRDVWGQGYAREAAQVSIEWGWAHCPDSEIFAWTVAANTGSWGLMERLGMRHRLDCDFDHPVFASDHPLSRHIVYSIGRPA